MRPAPVRGNQDRVQRAERVSFSGLWGLLEGEGFVAGFRDVLDVVVRSCFFSCVYVTDFREWEGSVVGRVAGSVFPLLFLSTYCSFLLEEEPTAYMVWCCPAVDWHVA